MAYKYAKRMGGDSCWAESDEKDDCNTTDANDLFSLFKEIHEKYSGQLEQLEDDDDQMQYMETSTSDAKIAFDKAINNLNTDRTDDNNISCAKCSTAVRVEDVSQFETGQHISMPGQYSSAAFSYKHHAIVKRVTKLYGNHAASLELIECSSKEGVLNIFKSEKKVDLRQHEICIIKYLHPRYNAKEILRRAESMVLDTKDKCKFEGYNPLLNNCEHFATWCVVGEGQSFQVQNLRQTVINGLKILHSVFNGGTVITKHLSKISNCLSRFGSVVTKVTGNFEKGIKFGVSEGLYLMVCVFMTICLLNDHLIGQICRKCLKQNMWDMWMHFFAFGTPALAAFFIKKFAIPLLVPEIAIPLHILTILLAIPLQWSVSKVRQILKSPFQITKSVVKRFSDINVGDVISTRYRGIPHDMIVTELHELTDDMVNLRCVHYSLPTWNILGTRTVVEEYFKIDISKGNLKKYDCTHLLTYENEEVVRRARKRIGETKWNINSNRSDHLCFWAKVKQQQTLSYNDFELATGTETKAKKLKDCFLGEKEVHLYSDIQLGDVITFHKKTGLLVGRRCLHSQTGRFFEIEMIFNKSFGRLRCNRYTIDLNKNDLRIERYHPANCYPMETRAERARSFFNKQRQFPLGASFREYCIIMR